jgi:hypothetical protein
VNRLGQFWHYVDKVFDLPRRLRGVRDERAYPVIPTAAVTASLFLGALLRLPSFLQMALDTRRRGWRRLVGLKQPVSPEVFGYVTERYRLEDLRAVLVATNTLLKRNKAFESVKLHGLLVVAIDGNEQFQSRCRCCEQCRRRRVTVKDPATGQEQEVLEYYPSTSLRPDPRTAVECDSGCRADPTGGGGGSGRTADVGPDATAVWAAVL